jgi:subtilase family serine protease
VDWEAKLGKYTLIVVADPADDIGEGNEFNNNMTKVFDISTSAPDIYVEYTNIIFDPAEPTIEETVNITVQVGNRGGTNPSHFNNLVYVDIYLGDPDSGGIKISNTTRLGSIEPNKYGNAYAEISFNDVGTYDIYVTAATDLDSDLSNNEVLTVLEIFNFPDLTISAEGITFLPGTEVAKGVEVTIQASVYNIGDANARNVDVDFYNGDPAGSGTLIGTQTVEIVSGRGAQPVLVEQKFTVGTTGIQNIYVVLDSPNNTRELNEDNNRAFNTFKVLKEPDLYIKSDYITLTGDKVGHIMQDETITINATVENIGETTAGTFDINFYFKSPANLIGTQTVLVNLLPNTKTSVEVQWNPHEVGTNNMLVWVDQADQVLEIDDADNNQVLYPFRVFSKPQLSMDDEDLKTDLTTVPTTAYFSQKVMLNATIRNSGESDAASFWVQFYDGNPAEDGLIIEASKKISGIPAGGDRSVEVEWTAEPGGEHTIYFKIDTFNNVIEGDETDNTMTLGIYVMTLPELQVSSSDIIIEGGEYGRIDEAVSINVTIHNTGDTDSVGFRVNFYDGYPKHADTGPAFDTIVVTEGLETGESTNAEVEWTPRTFGLHKIYVWVDETNDILEVDIENNLAGKNFEVLNFAADLKVDTSDIKALIESVATTQIKTNVDYTFSVTIHNVGNEEASGFNVTIEYVIGEETKTHLLGDQNNFVDSVITDNGSVAFTTTWRPVVSGTYDFTVTVDSTDDIREFNEDDNEGQISFTVSTRPNIYIADKTNDISIVPIEPKMGEDVTISVKATITGDYEITQLTMKFLVNGVQVGDPYTAPITPGAEGQAATANFEIKWRVDNEGFSNLEFELDPDNLEEESNENDNKPLRDDVYVSGKKADDKEAGMDMTMILLLVIIIIIVVVVVVVLVVMKRRKAKKPFECPECSAMVEPDATECPECGAEVSAPAEVVECQKCGAEMTLDDANCPECGEPNASYIPPEEGMEGDEGGGVMPGEEAKGIQAAPPAAAPAPVAAAAPAPAPAPPKPKKKKKVPAPRPGPSAAPSAMPAPAVSEQEMAELEGMEGMMSEEGEGEAECYKCGARVPLSVPKCPVCGADFE